METNEKEIPEIFLVLRFGKNVFTKNGETSQFDVAEADVDAIIREFEERKRDLVIDYEHQSLNGQKAPAAGWIDRLEKTAEGLQAHVRYWTEDAQKYLKSGEYRYFSPTLYFSEGKPVALHSVALTNHPALHCVEALVASDINSPDLSKRTRKDIPLRGIIRCGHCDCPMMPSYAKKKGVTYYYYLCEKHEKSTGYSPCPVKKVPVGIIEKLVKEQLGKVFGASEVLETLAGKTGIPQEEIKKMFREDFWNEVTPAEFTRLAQLLLDRVTLFDDHIELDIKIENMTSIIEEFAKDEN